jgi:hypothetical protein
MDTFYGLLGKPYKVFILIQPQVLIPIQAFIGDPIKLQQVFFRGIRIFVGLEK